MPLPDEIPPRGDGGEPRPAPAGGEQNPAQPEDQPPMTPAGADRRVCARETDPDTPPPRLTLTDRLVLTVDTLSRLARAQLAAGWRAVTRGGIVTERSPSPRDRFARVARLARGEAMHPTAAGGDDEAVGVADLHPLVRYPYLAGEFLAATVATALQTAANSVGTLLGLATTAAAGLLLLHTTLGVPL